MKETQIFIGPNGTHKTELLDFIFKKKAKDKENNVLFVRSENNWKEEFELKKETLLNEFKGFLENLYLHELKYETLEKSKLQGFKEKKEKLNTKISDLFEGSDDNVIKTMKSIIKITDNFPESDKVKFVVLNKLTSKNSKEIIGGTGQKFYTFLKLVLIFCQLSEEHNAEKTYLLIDEPEKFCHPNLIAEISYLLKEISEKINLYIVSHSSLFINNFIDKKNRGNIELFRCLNKEKLGGDELLKYEEKNSESFQKIELSILHEKNELLNYPIFSLNAYESLFAQKIILVEGIADQMIVKMIINEININNRNKNVFIFNTLGKKAMKCCIKWLQNNKINDFFVLFDEDKLSKDENNDLLNSEILELIGKKNYFSFEQNIETSFNVKKTGKSFPEWILDEEIMKEIKEKPEYIELKEKITDFVQKKITKRKL